MNIVIQPIRNGDTPIILMLSFAHPIFSRFLLASAMQSSETCQISLASCSCQLQPAISDWYEKVDLKRIPWMWIILGKLSLMLCYDVRIFIEDDEPYRPTKHGLSDVTSLATFLLNRLALFRNQESLQILLA